MIRLTPKQLHGLRWFASSGEVCWFERGAPTHAIRTRLVQRGLVEHVPDKRQVHVKRLRITEAGRDALCEGGWL